MFARHAYRSRQLRRNCAAANAGVGNTLVSEVLSQPQLDFGAQFVGRPWQLEVTVANMGRKAATLAWSNSKLAELAKTFGKTAKGTGAQGQGLLQRRCCDAKLNCKYAQQLTLLSLFCPCTHAFH
jgi:hypothetical protein